jgi:hypothetical protein
MPFKRRVGRGLILPTKAVNTVFQVDNAIAFAYPTKLGMTSNKDFQSLLVALRRACGIGALKPELNIHGLMALSPSRETGYSPICYLTG